ncbi:protein ALTERED PHOSPHATE STARVATION RESPONSE 1 isoform X4 [Triticum aestivum]|uniref:protein ALTERED PHOSPHATE STARVATION RESPONSE 1 isoform X4 n=1 Tax=Triticum aestivum TaxID=4565 RepID=UPI001D02CD45|nr:protein ALTERED PHOSPHATE STARVATION RESPONSE 1-like isoform X4 [Triticum aestivum]
MAASSMSSALSSAPRAPSATRSPPVSFWNLFVKQVSASIGMAMPHIDNYERLKQEHDKKVGLLRKQEVRGMDYLKMEKNKMEMESLESKMLVATQSIDTTTSEIIRLRESELFPQR